MTVGDWSRIPLGILGELWNMNLSCISLPSEGSREAGVFIIPHFVDGPPEAQRRMEPSTVR